MMMVILVMVQMMTMVKKMAGEKMAMAMTMTMAELRGESREELDRGAVGVRSWRGAWGGAG